MSSLPSVRLQFWGVRGSIPTPQAENLGYGGNTACLEIRCGGQPPLIFDAGSGIRRLGTALMEEGVMDGGQVHVFLTHFHWDHIQGIPFFSPLFQPAWQLSLCSICPPGSLQRILEAQMGSPYFTAMSAIRAGLQYRQIEPGGIQLGELVVRPFPLRHPDGVVGYRIQAPGAAIVYATDHEHGDEASDALLREHARGADILIYDAQYTPEEYEQKRGWGHSTWLEAARVASDAKVKQLVLFHHDPQHDDRTISEIVARARTVFENTVGAREGRSITLNA